MSVHPVDETTSLPLAWLHRLTRSAVLSDDPSVLGRGPSVGCMVGGPRQWNQGGESLQSFVWGFALSFRKKALCMSGLTHRILQRSKVALRSNGGASGLVFPKFALQTPASQRRTVPLSIVPINNFHLPMNANQCNFSVVKTQSLHAVISHWHRLLTLPHSHGCIIPRPAEAELWTSHKNVGRSDWMSAIYFTPLNESSQGEIEALLFSTPSCEGN
jgi:hypothetical protein